MDDDAAREVKLRWAIDHCIEEVNFGTGVVVLGDPEVLWTAPPITEAALGGRAWELVDLPGGTVLVMASLGQSDGPWAHVIGNSDGGVASLVLRPSIWTDAQTDSVERSLTLRSGRLVAGAPNVVAAWGPAVEPHGGVAQTKTGWDLPEPTYLGLILVVAVPSVDCPLDVAFTAAGELHAVAIHFPQPNWLPQPLAP